MHNNKDCKAKAPFSGTYNSIANGGGVCPVCYSTKNQKAAHFIAEYTFDQDFEMEKRIYQILDELASHLLEEGFTTKAKEISNMKATFHILSHIDDFCRFVINGRMISLGIERHGREHMDTEGGYNYYVDLNRKPDNAKTRAAWRRLIENDKRKVDLFNDLASEDYYLIVMPHNIRRWEMQRFIVTKFKELTGLTLSGKAHFNVDRYLG